MPNLEIEKDYADLPAKMDKKILLVKNKKMLDYAKIVRMFFITCAIILLEKIKSK